MASATNSIVPATISWFAAFTVCPAPEGPTCTTVLPTASRMGSASATSASLPPTMIDRVASTAPNWPPLTGASTTRNWRFAPAAATSLAASGLMVAAAGAKRQFRVVDAPVSGGQFGAVEATLSIMVGGSEADVALALPILEAVGKTVVHVGPSGAGQTVKAANQLIVAGTIELVAEAIVLLEAYGVDTEAAVKVLAGGLAGNAILQRKAAGMLARDFTPGFRIDLHHKDMGIVTAAARDAGVVIPLGALTAQLVASQRAQGHGSLDHSSLLMLVEQLSGRGEVRHTPTEEV